MADAVMGAGIASGVQNFFDAFHTERDYQRKLIQQAFDNKIKEQQMKLEQTKSGREGYFETGNRAFLSPDDVEKVGGPAIAPLAISPNDPAGQSVNQTPSGVAPSPTGLIGSGNNSGGLMPHGLIGQQNQIPGEASGIPQIDVNKAMGARGLDVNQGFIPKQGQKLIATAGALQALGKGQLEISDLQNKLNRNPIELAKAQAELAKANREAKGQTVPSEAVQEFGNAQAINQRADSLIQMIDANKDIFGPIQGRISQGGAQMQLTERGKRANEIEAALNSAADVFGRAQTGGQLTPQKLNFTKSQMGGLSDDPEVAKWKINQQRDLALQAANARQGAFKQAGYNVGDVNVPAAPGNAAIKPPKASDSINSASANEGIQYKPGLVRNGYRFKGGDPTNKSNWARVK